MNKQQDFWAGDFGTSWAKERNSFASAFTSWERDSRTKLPDLLDKFLGHLDHDISICEFGCNDGFVLKTLQDMGFNDLSGIDINNTAIQNAGKNLPDANFICMPLEDFKCSDKFDLVFTSAVLMHIHPDNLREAMMNIYDNSGQYIFGRELSSEIPHIPSNVGKRWKEQYFVRRFKDLWMKKFADLKLLQYELIPMQSIDEVQTEVYLLEKI